jgi:hypothetical protein
MPTSLLKLFTVPFCVVPFCAVTFCLMALPAAAASAGGDWKGELSSTLLSPLPARPVFDMEVYDDTDQNLAFRRSFLDALARTGYQVRDDAPFTFSFATSVTWQQKRQKELQTERVRKYPVERDETSVPLGRETDPAGNPETRMFGDRRTTPPLVAPRISNAEHNRLDISVTLRDHRSGKVLWTADLALPLLQEDRNRIVRSIIGPIIGAIGRDVSHEPFEVK